MFVFHHFLAFWYCFIFLYFSIQFLLIFLSFSQYFFNLRLCPLLLFFLVFFCHLLHIFIDWMIVSQAFMLVVGIALDVSFDVLSIFNLSWVHTTKKWGKPTREWKDKKILRNYYIFADIKTRNAEWTNEQWKIKLDLN